MRASRGSRLHYAPPAHRLVALGLRSPQCRWWSSSTVLGRSREKVKPRLPMTPARTRFAPSPTGFMHLGSLRTALFNYMLAKRTGGKFLLRIEDTDDKRTVQGAEASICEDLQWAGLDWDEGPGISGPFGPYRQSERTPLYQKHAQDLLDSGHAYRCFCSPERLDTLARQRSERGLPTDYDRQCHGIPKDESDEKAAQGEPFVIRFISPYTNYPGFKDENFGWVGPYKSDSAVAQKYGEISFEDPILLKTDGRPTYHLANVVDDHHMRITHVIRGTEWMSSTPKHMALYQALGWDPPKFAHVALLLDKNGAKLSKRKADTDVATFRDIWGILPSALVNFLALQGWHHGRRVETMDLQELVSEFSMAFTKGETTVTFEKLWFLQRAHAVKAAQTGNAELVMLVESVCRCLRNEIKIHKVPNPAFSIQDYVLQLVLADAKAYETPVRFCNRNRFFFETPKWKIFKNRYPLMIPTSGLRAALEEFMARPDDDWHGGGLFEAMQATIDRLAQQVVIERPLPASEARTKGPVPKRSCRSLFFDYLRWVLLDHAEGPSLVSTLMILGPGESRARLRMTAAFEEKDDVQHFPEEQAQGSVL